MVRILTGLILLTLALGAQAKRIKIYPAEPMLGQAVTLSMPADIEFIEKRFNWAALEKCFAVAQADYGSERVRFTLYPYQAGPCEIKREKWETWEVPSHFNIRPNPAVSVRWTAPKAQVFAREAIVWQAQVQLTEHSGYSVWLQQPGKGALTYRFSPDEITEELFTAVGWLEQTGKQKLYSPFVAVKNPGGQVWRFPAPPQMIKVVPLPVYLPANIVVGKLHWQISSLPSIWPRSDLLTLPLRLGGPNINPAWLPAIDQHLPPTKGVRWLVASRQVQNQWQGGQLISEVRLDQPVQFQGWGRIELPPLSVRYFDPDTRRLEEATLTLPAVVVLPAWLIRTGQLLIALVGLATALMILYGLWWLLWYGWLWRQRRQTPDQLWAAMGAFIRWTRFKSPPASLTPNQWLDTLPRLIRPHWRETVEHLNRALFSSHPSCGE